MKGDAGTPASHPNTNNTFTLQTVFTKVSI